MGNSHSHVQVSRPEEELPNLCAELRQEAKTIHSTDLEELWAQYAPSRHRGRYVPLSQRVLDKNAAVRFLMDLGIALGIPLSEKEAKKIFRLYARSNGEILGISRTKFYKLFVVQSRSLLELSPSLEVDYYKILGAPPVGSFRFMIFGLPPELKQLLIGRCEQIFEPDWAHQYDRLFRRQDQRGVERIRIAFAEDRISDYPIEFYNCFVFVAPVCRDVNGTLVLSESSTHDLLLNVNRVAEIKKNIQPHEEIQQPIAGSFRAIENNYTGVIRFLCSDSFTLDESIHLREQLLAATKLDSISSILDVQSELLMPGSLDHLKSIDQGELVLIRSLFNETIEYWYNLNLAGLISAKNETGSHFGFELRKAK